MDKANEIKTNDAPTLVSDILVTDVMHPHVVTIQRSRTIIEAIALMQQQQVHTLIIRPETQRDSYGIITVRDIVYQVIARRINPKTVIVADIMRSPCVVVYPDLNIYEAAQRLADAAIQRAPVIGFSERGDDQLLGIISISDIVMELDLAILEAEQLPPTPEDSSIYLGMGMTL